MSDITFRQELLRKLVHLSSIWMIFVMWFAGGFPAFCLFLILAVLNLMLEYAKDFRFQKKV